MGFLDPARFWNATAAEKAAAYPAHQYAVAPYRTFIRAVDVAAPPAVVFRWLCQLKVAPYSYDWLDNRGRRSPRELTPGAEKLATGQRLMIARIVEFEPDRHITGVSLPAATALFGAMSLTYQVTATAGGSRLVACLDVTARSWSGRVRADLLAVGDLVMMRRQLLNLKALAECSEVAV
jgi:Polyketide cyclase / dehydrase and lipid transport